MLKEIETKYFGWGMTSAHLRSIADEMDRLGYEYIDISADIEGDMHFESGVLVEQAYRRETPEEEAARLEKIKQNRKESRELNKKAKVDRAINDVKKLLKNPNVSNLVIEPIKTTTKDVYWVCKGCIIGTYKFESEGYVKVVKNNGVIDIGKVYKKEKEAK